MNCPHCQHILPDNYSARYCPFCGNDFPKGFPIEPSVVRPTGPRPITKWKWWLAFWLVFVGSPCVSLRAVRTALVSDAAAIVMLSSLAVGGIICSWLLSRIFRGRVSARILFMVLVWGSYLVLLFLLIMVLGIAMAHGF